MAGNSVCHVSASTVECGRQTSGFRHALPSAVCALFAVFAERIAWAAPVRSVASRPAVLAPLRAAGVLKAVLAAAAHGASLVRTTRAGVSRCARPRTQRPPHVLTQRVIANVRCDSRVLHSRMTKRARLIASTSIGVVKPVVHTSLRANDERLDKRALARRTSEMSAELNDR